MPRAFTLIEILVVVAIIALLVAILLPSLARARSQARSAVCSSNVRQMAMGANLFAAQYRDRVPRGISRNGDIPGRVSWVTMVIRQFGNKKNYLDNVNRVPVEKYEVFTCPQRTTEYAGRFLDYVVNSMDHRGPIDLDPCQPDPAGTWYEVQGVTKTNVWPRPAEVVYVTEAIEESWSVSDHQNTWGTMRGIREHIDTVRAEQPPEHTGIDWFDVPGGSSVPMYRDMIYDATPRAALKMHGNRGSNGAFVDGHVESIRPPPAAVGQDEIRRFYYRKFGVDHKAISSITSLDTAGSFDPCTAGDIFWHP